MRLIYALAIATITLAIGCKGDTNSKASAPTTSNVTKTVTANQIPSVPAELMKKLFMECDYTDYIFHDLPFSMSQDEQASIRANLNYVSTEPIGSIPAGCKPMGRQFYHINGEIVLEANVYYDANCKFYVFVDGEKPLYANKMTETGEKFFSSMIAQAGAAQQGNLPGAVPSH